MHNDMNNLIPTLLTGSLLLTAAGCHVRKEQPAAFPNIVYIFPDQFRNHAMGFWSQDGFREHVAFRGDPVHTPYLDRFARESLVLTSAVSNCPLSSPHRGMLLTGMYPHRSGIPLNCNSLRPLSSLREDAECISDVFSKAGYDCGYFGKLHAEYPTPNDPGNPGHYVEEQRPVWDAYTPPSRRHGFNYWYSYGTFDVHKAPHYWDTSGRRHDVQEWSPLHEAEEVVSYLKNERQQRTPGKPFFVMVGMNPPHSPYRSVNDCMEEDYALYRNLPADSLLVRPNADATMEKAQCAPFYFASVTGVDRAFGLILKALKETGLDKNTIVVFTSDHGETLCSQATNDPKNSPYAESLNVPFLVRYPGRIAPRTDNLLLSSPDIMPTLLGLAGLDARIPKEVQGRNYAPLFLGDETTVARPQGALYFRNLDGATDADGIVQSYFPEARGIKTERYTLALYIDRETRRICKTLFFDDVRDPYQLHNIAPKDEPETFARLCKETGRLLKAVGDPWYAERIAGDLLQYGE